jgi:enoyl-CoA hydratase
MTEPRSGPVQVEDRGRVRIFRLDDPDTRNALSAALLEELAERLREADDDADVRCLVLAGTDRVFASGADIRLLAEADPAEMYLGRRPRQWDAIAAIRTPMLAAISGACLGGGLELALRCDILTCSVRSKFGLPETGIGLLPGAGGTQLLTRAVGRALAAEMILAGRVLDGTEAVEVGLTSRAFPEDSWFEDSVAIATQVASRPALAQQLAKDSIRLAQSSPPDVGLEAERRAFAMALGTDEAKEGLAAFLEKRTPDWSEGKDP